MPNGSFVDVRGQLIKRVGNWEVKREPHWKCDKEPIGSLSNHMSVIYRKFAAYQEEKGVYTANLRYKIPDKGY